MIDFGKTCWLVNRSRLDQLEECSLDLEMRAIDPLQFKTARHRPEGRGQRTARGVFKGLTRLESGLFPNDARPVNFFGVSGSIDDRPMPIEKLDGRFSFVRNLNRIEKKPATGGGMAVLWRITSSNTNANAGGFGFGGGFKKIAFGHGRDFSRPVMCKRHGISR